MDGSTIFKVAAGVSGIFSLASFILAVIAWAGSKSERRGLEQYVQGETKETKDTLISVLKEFKDEDKRLRALEQYLNWDRQKAKGLLDKVRKNVDIERFAEVRDRTAERRYVVLGVIGLFVLIAVGVLHSLGVPDDDGSVLVMPSKASAAIISEKEPCDSDAPTFRIRWNGGKWRPLSRCGLLFGAEEAEPQQITTRTEVTSAGATEKPTALPKQDPDVLKDGDIELEYRGGDGFAACGRATLDTATHGDARVWIVDAVQSCG